MGRCQGLYLGVGAGERGLQTVMEGGKHLRGIWKVRTVRWREEGGE